MGNKPLCRFIDRDELEMGKSFSVQVNLDCCMEGCRAI